MRVYHERLRVPVSWWVLDLLSAIMLGAGLLAGFAWEPALVVYGAIIVPLAAFLLARPYLPRAVYIPVEDPAGVTPYWLIGTRRPAELAAAIEAARPAARAGGTPVG